MNDRNRELFFNDDSDEVAVVTMTDEDGVETDAALVATFEIEELGKEYVVLMPTEQDEDNLAEGEGEVLIMEYTEDADGAPSFNVIEDEEEFEVVSQAFDNIMDSGELEIDTEEIE